MSQKTQPFSMRLDPDLKEALQGLADADNRSLTNYVETVLRQHVAKAWPPQAKHVTVYPKVKKGKT